MDGSEIEIPNHVVYHCTTDTQEAPTEKDVL